MNRHMKGDSCYYSKLSLEGRWTITNQLWEITVGRGRGHLCHIRIEQHLWFPLCEAPCIPFACFLCCLQKCCGCSCVERLIWRKMEASKQPHDWAQKPILNLSFQIRRLPSRQRDRKSERLQLGINWAALIPNHTKLWDKYWRSLV